LNQGKFKINAVLFGHTAWILFIYLTWPLTFFYHYYNVVYFIGMLLTLASSWGLGGCWLTDLENKLRGEHVPETVYEERCLNYYGKKWLGIKIPQYIIRSAFAILLLTSLYLLITKN
jgi:hypothetical protein